MKNYLKDSTSYDRWDSTDFNSDYLFQPVALSEASVAYWRDNWLPMQSAWY